MKKLFSVLIILALLLQLCACDLISLIGEKQEKQPTSTTDKSNIKTEAPAVSKTETDANTEGEATPPDTPSDEPSDTPSDSEPYESRTEPSENTVDEETPPDEPSDESSDAPSDTPFDTTGESPSDITTAPNTPSTPGDSDPVQAHTALSPTLYYQYSHLTVNERRAYERLREAALVYAPEIDISDLSLGIDAIQKTMECFVADNPQYFWIAPTYVYSTSVIRLHYTDGTNADSADDLGANHERIDQRREELDQAVEAIIAQIDPSLSDYEKELFLHDYLTQSLHYDSAATEVPTVNGVLVDSFCAYGALINGYAVCEGYSEAFQYLCYCVGINATQIFGAGHVWNAVQLEGEWYQIDVTWDDPVNQFGKDGDGTHEFFNLTDDEMYEAHPLDRQSLLYVPTCTATKHAYREAEAK